jgi:hypothetical protein
LDNAERISPPTQLPASPITQTAQADQPSADAEQHRAVEPFVLYEGAIQGLTLNAFGASIPVSDILTNGRANYVLFQKLVGLCAGLDAHSEGGDSDLSGDGAMYEVKAYPDHELHPGSRFDLFHTAASSTFEANNRGPVIKQLLADQKYAEALKICVDTGYGKNDFYVYTNTSKFNTSTPFRFVILPTETVLTLLSTTDPRLLSRTAVLAACTRTETLTAAHLFG